MSNSVISLGKTIGDTAAQKAASEIAQSSAASAAKLAKVQGIGVAIQVGGEIIGMGITAASTIKDQKLRREFENELAKMNAEEQKVISEKILAAQTDNDKRKILAQTLLELAKARIEQANKNNTIWYVIGGIVVLGLGYFIYKRVKK
jgi:hypothetical protein